MGLENRLSWAYFRIAVKVNHLLEELLRVLSIIIPPHQVPNSEEPEGPLGISIKLSF